jgi:septal ring factor EnvC (AmiA/AmiB activator)
MLHLAQVRKNQISGEMELQFLAHQQSDNLWEIIDFQSIPLQKESFQKEGLLVLVELGEHQQIINIKEAKDWIMNLINKYLTQEPITPEFVERERERIEHWRQEITAQSLDLTRRYLELETHQEQIQELENTLKQEKQKLEQRWQKIQESEAELKVRWQELKNFQE